MTATITNQRVNIRLTHEQHEYLSEIAWRNRTNMTEYVRELINADIKKQQSVKASKQAVVNDYDGF